MVIRNTASRLKGEDVAFMLEDRDWTVRLEAVKNAPIAALESLEEDDEEVLFVIGERLDEFYASEKR
ncbi:MAG: hypothetical protein AAGJ37_11945 [Pseudomonadota bacterium]